MSGLTYTDRRLFQYKNAARLEDMLNGFFEQANNAACGDLINFFDVDNASGEWLTILARLFNVKRTYTTLGSQLVLDYTFILDSDYILDGNNTPINDVILKALLKAQLMKFNTSVKNIEYIIKVFVSTINPKYIHVVEGDKTLTLFLAFDIENAFLVNVSLVNGTNVINGQVSQETMEKMLLLSALNGINPKWFGCPTGVSVQYSVSGG